MKWAVGGLLVVWVACTAGWLTLLLTYRLGRRRSMGRHPSGRLGPPEEWL